MLIDTHTHFYDEWLLPDAEEAISRALSAGVSKMIQADVDSTERPAMWAIGQKHPGVIFQMLGLYPGSVDSNWQEELDQVHHIASAARQTSGTLDQVHPPKADQVQHIASAVRQTSGTLDQVHHIASADRQALETLDQVQPIKVDQVHHSNQPQPANHPQPTTHPQKTDFINMPERFVAIGEIGLDYHEGKEFAKEQKEVLRLQFELAAKMNLPVNIHLRDAWEDFFAVLEDCRHLHLRGNLHCFTASYEIYERANKWADFSVGIGGVVTFKNSNLAKTLERIPMEKILLETDAPYLAPVPWRGRRNESAYLPIIAEKVAQIKGLSIDETADITTRNAEILFGI